MLTYSEEIVHILLATYNGEHFIREQLDSIINQTYKNWILLIRDDCSSDNTMSILLEYESKDSRIRVDKSHGENLGPCMNFNELMLKVQKEKYIMFSDQDDFWLPTKIVKTLNKMLQSEEKYGNNTPILVFTNFKIVDKNLKIIEECCNVYKYVNKSNLSELNILLGFNYIWGCTLMINNRLLMKSIPISTNAENHDYWIAMICAAIGEIVYMDEPTMLYRKHTANVTGGLEQNSLYNRFRRHLINRNKYKRIIIKQRSHIKAVAEYLEESGIRNVLIDEYLIVTNIRGLKAVKRLLKLKIYKQGILQTIGLYFFFIK